MYTNNHSKFCWNLVFSIRNILFTISVVRVWSVAGKKYSQIFVEYHLNINLDSNVVPFSLLFWQGVRICPILAGRSGTFLSGFTRKCNKIQKVKLWNFTTTLLIIGSWNYKDRLLKLCITKKLLFIYQKAIITVFRLKKKPLCIHITYTHIQKVILLSKSSSDKQGQIRIRFGMVNSINTHLNIFKWNQIWVYKFKYICISKLFNSTLI